MTILEEDDDVGNRSMSTPLSAEWHEAAKKARIAFWLRTMQDEKENMSMRLKASALMARACGDFSADESDDDQAKTVTYKVTWEEQPTEAETESKDKGNDDGKH